MTILSVQARDRRRSAALREATHASVGMQLHNMSNRIANLARERPLPVLEIRFEQRAMAHLMRRYRTFHYVDLVN